MKRIYSTVIIIFVLLGYTYGTYAQTNNISNKTISIIPQPYSVTSAAERFRLTPQTKIFIDPNNQELKKIAEMFVAHVKSATSMSLAIVPKSGVAMSNGIFFTMKNASDSLEKEGYQLTVANNNIILRANKGNGIFYGMQTLLQLFPVNKKDLSGSLIYLQGANIIDKPRFEWRGLMLDVGRFYYSMDFLKKYIDYLAMHKMNTFHWHLVEDHGWRLEIKKYPRLTDVGAWRAANQFDRTQLDQTAKGGYYTQEQAKELVAYAASKYINIVPEIEMPGHIYSALVAYPELSCTGGPFEMLSRWGIQKDIYCAGNEKTFEFIENVLEEVIAIFPSPIIHIGGDEAPKERWKACSKCQQRIKNEGLKDEHELQSYFIKRIEDFLLTKNKSIIGWDEILEGGLAPNASVMSWRGVKGGIEAAKQHHNVIMTPNNYFYLDYYQGKPYQEPLSMGSELVTLEKVYSFEPVAKELSAEEGKFIKGVQGNVWSEYIHSPEKVEYMAFPRAAAVAEIGWSSPASRNWEDFKRRMEYQYARYDLAGINYAKSAYNVWQTAKIDSVAKTALISFKTDSYNPEIRFTLDGNEPTQHSQLYTTPFKVNIPILIKAATFRNGKKIGKINEEAVILR